MDVLDICTDYLICQNKHATATGLSEILEGDIAHDKVTRFLRLNEFGSKALTKSSKKILLIGISRPRRRTENHPPPRINCFSV